MEAETGSEKNKDNCQSICKREMIQQREKCYLTLIQ